MEDSHDKRKRSDDGLLGLLGTYASEDEEDGMASSPKRPRSSEGDGVFDSLRAQSEEPLTDITAALTIATQRLEEIQKRGASQAASPSEDEVADNAAIEALAEEDEEELYRLPLELAEPPQIPCPQDIQDKVADYIEKQEAVGTTISNRLRSLSGYRNPSFLQHCVMYENISEYGTCYPPEIFDPNNLPPEDYYDRLAVEWQQQAERQRLDRGKTQKIDFAKAGTETLGRSNAAGLNASSVAANLVAQAKSMQRASKWDAKR